MRTLYSVLRRERIEFIHRILPDLRLILTVRHPVERSWSAARRVLGKLGLSLDEMGDDLRFYHKSSSNFYKI